MIDSFDDTKPPAAAIVAKWPKYMQEEFNAAMAWIEQEEEHRAPAKPEKEASTDATGNQ